MNHQINFHCEIFHIINKFPNSFRNFQTGNRKLEQIKTL